MCWIYSYPGDAGPSSQWGQYLNAYEMTLIALPIGRLAPLMFVIKSCHDTDLWIITASSRWLCIDDKYQYEVVGIHASPNYDMLHGIWLIPFRASLVSQYKAALDALLRRYFLMPLYPWLPRRYCDFSQS